ncbi:hypothetical protein CYJ10_33575 [Cupriavidus pauculus]|uniref:Lipoprotein n=1 Tax=Cupriavidus pauculus TaxID=82633 RepID=A0A2N5C1V2_9BURK|nr:hypothetical protein CYJ10_33575 [Cupriavidus pauculus]
MRFLAIPAVAACLLSAACTTTAPSYTGPYPGPFSGRQLSTYDMSTEYATEYSPDGFTLLVYHRYQQFTMLRSTAAAECKTAAGNVATSVADRWNRKLAPMDDSRVQLNTSRNWLGKITACSAKVPVVWEH